jgi:hypothetical protein
MLRTTSLENRRRSTVLFVNSIIVRIAANASAILQSPSARLQIRFSFLCRVSIPRIVIRKGGILTVKQLEAVESSVRSAPLAVGSQVHVNLKNFSPGKHVASDKASQAKVARLVRQHSKELMAARIPGINLDDAEGAMVRLAQSLSLSRHIKKHNDPADPYHLNEHQTFCLGYQFKDCVTFMCLSTTHMRRLSTTHISIQLRANGKLRVAETNSSGWCIQLVRKGFRFDWHWLQHVGWAPTSTRFRSA